MLSMIRLSRRSSSFKCRKAAVRLSSICTQAQGLEPSRSLAEFGILLVHSWHVGCIALTLLRALFSGVQNNEDETLHMQHVQLLRVLHV